MKPKYIFLIMSLIIILLITTIALSLNNPIAEEKKEETYSKETAYIINDLEYSIVIEKFKIIDNEVTYTKSIHYHNKEKINYKETANIDYDKFTINNQTFYIIENKVCKDETCSSFYAPYIEKETKKMNLNINDYILPVNNIKKYWNDNISIFYIYDNNYEDLSSIVKDYDIKIYTLNKNITSKKMIQEYHLDEQDSIILIFNKENLIGEIEPNKLHEYLFHLGTNSR